MRSIFYKLQPKWLLDFRSKRSKINSLIKLYKGSKKTIFNSFEETKSVFIHIPKCAGISIGKSLYGQELSWGHYTSKEVEKVIGKLLFEKCYKFTFVRNPWDRTYSAYNFLKKGGLSPQDKKWSEKVLSKYATFEEFILKGLNTEEVISWIHFIPQSDYIYDERGELLVDFVGRFENIANDFEKIRLKVGGEKLLSLNQKRANDPYQQYYTTEMKNIISEVYDNDINRLGYKFD